MPQDTCRTGTYYSAILQNVSDFYGKVVVDVGAGTGILSLFACQAGAKKVYAIEASDMAAYAKQLAEGNPMLGQRVEIIHGKIEDVDLPEKADILISEPMGAWRCQRAHAFIQRFLVGDVPCAPCHCALARVLWKAPSVLSTVSCSTTLCGVSLPRMPAALFTSVVTLSRNLPSQQVDSWASGCL